MGWETWTGFIWLGIGTGGVNEPLGFIKCFEFLVAEELFAFQEGICCVSE
jgi:hypothetical protein